MPVSTREHAEIWWADAEGDAGSYTVWFGGSYRECWTENYKLSIAYADRRPVQARLKNGVWVPVGGDASLVGLLKSEDCPQLLAEYFQTAATVYAAARQCVSMGLGLDRIGEVIRFVDEPFAAPELLRLLMDDCGFPLSDAYTVVASCCTDLLCRGVDLQRVTVIQPRTASVIGLMRSYGMSNLSVVHVSCDERFRSPLGALEEGSELRLAVALQSGSVERAELILYGDELYRELPMERSAEGFAVTLRMPDKAAALWYRFRLETADGAHWLCPDAGGLRGRLYGWDAPGFRLTVYRRGFETPNWFRRSVMYQIFPDRFAFSQDGTAERGIAYHRALGQTPELHRSTEEEVRWQPRDFEQSYTPDDFYGGTLRGIEEKLPYLKRLGVSCLYLNPIVEARSNHRYDTSDYLKVDPILGTNADLTHLCRAAEQMGIRVILDGVFSHTGDDSVYFNRFGHYPGLGACQGEQSPYYDWYEFRHFPDEYRSWWGFESLPEVEETKPTWQDFVVSGPNSVVKTWLRRGAAGWRLDVADELPDSVLALIREAAKAARPDALVLGEVWEDAVVKESYGARRNYALGYSLDSVMNYPLRTAILDFIHGGTSSYELRDFLIGQQMNYPRPLYYSLMNLLGSHDVERLRSALATKVHIKALSREDQLKLEFTPEALERALTLEKIVSVLQFALPGVPSIYYGDEQGMSGVGDPFNRRPFRLGEKELCEHYTALARQRHEAPALATGHARFFSAGPDVLLVLRWISGGKDVFGEEAEDGVYLAVINRSAQSRRYLADCSAAGLVSAVSGEIAPLSAEILRLPSP